MFWRKKTVVVVPAEPSTGWCEICDNYRMLIKGYIDIGSIDVAKRLTEEMRQHAIADHKRS